MAPALLTSTSTRGSAAAISAPTRRASLTDREVGQMGRVAEAGRERLKPLQQRVGARAVAGDEHDARAHPRQRLDRLLAQARRRAGGDHDLALHHRICPR